MVHSPQEQTPPLTFSLGHPSAKPQDQPALITNVNQYFINQVLDTVKQTNLRMGDEPAKELEEYPCIDISSWMEPHGERSERERVVAEVTKQAMEAGSFNISNYGVTDDLFERMASRSKKFFELPLEEKQNYASENKGGYLAIQSESAAAVYNDFSKETERRDLREVYSAVYPPESPINAKGPNFYREVIDEYLHRMTAVDTVLHSILTAALAKAKGVNLPEDLLNFAKGTSTGLLRCSRYPKVSEEYDGAIKLKAHSDWGPLTIIYSESPGLLEIRDGKWIRVPVRKGQLHVVIGETMSVWSNLLFKNNIHCVSSDASPDRISYPYFAGAGESNGEEGIEPICAAGEAPLFGKLSASSHVDAYCKKYFNS